VRRSTRSRVDHFGRGLQVVAATADRCNTSATNRVVQHRRRWRTVTTAGISTSLSLPLYLYIILLVLSHAHSSSFLLLSSTLSSFLVQYTEYALTDSTTPLVPLLRYHLPFLHSYPPPYPSPTLSSPPGSSQRCTTHVLTERHTSDLRGSRCDPLRVRHPPDGGCFGVAPRAVLSPFRISRRLSSRLETIRYAGDPGPS